jgi:PAS domain S-box-containing protein
MDLKATRAVVEAFSAMEHPFFAIDTSYRYTAFNEAYAERMRNVYRSDVALGKCILDEPAPAADRARAMKTLGRALDGKQVIEEYSPESPGIPRQYFRVTYIPIRGAGGAVEQIAVISVNLSEMKRTEESLRANGELFTALFHHSPSPKLLARFPEGEILDVNDAFQRLTEYPREQLVGNLPDAHDMWKHPGDLAEMTRQLTEFGRVEDFETEFRTATGAVRNLYLSGTLLEFRGQRYMSGTAANITKIRQAEAELRAALEEVRTLRGIIPICASCKKIRDDKGYWSQVEVYIKRHTDADFTHSLCPECIERIYGGFDPEDWQRRE